MNTNRDFLGRIGKTVGKRWIGLVVAGAGLGAAIVYLLRSTERTTPDSSRRRVHISNHIVDDRGTSQDEASRMLLRLRDRAFDSSDEKLALALGRPQEEVEGWHSGMEPIDDDVVIKARGIAMHRGVDIG